MEINASSSLLQSYSFRSNIITETETEAETIIDVVEELTEVEAGTEVELTAEEELALFKEELYSEISEIYKNAPSNLLSSSVKITDEALEKMKDDPDFKEEMLESMKSDADGLSVVTYSVHMSISIDADGYSRSEISVNSSDSQTIKDAKAKLAELEGSGAFYFEEVNEIGTTSALQELLNSLNGGTSSMTQDEKQKALLDMISEQKDFIQQYQEHTALANNATSSNEDFLSSLSVSSNGFLA